MRRDSVGSIDDGFVSWRRNAISFINNLVLDDIYSKMMNVVTRIDLMMQAMRSFTWFQPSLANGLISDRMD